MRDFGKPATSKFLAELPKRLSTARQAAQISIRELAAAAKLDAEKIGDWENGKAVPDLFEAADFAAALGITIDKLVCG